MPQLVAPRLDVAPSAREVARGPDPDRHPAYAELADLADDQLGDWLDRLAADTREGTPRPEGFVPSTTLWWVEGPEFLGRVQLRHRLTPRLRELGGHVGYWIAPAHRRRGHATALLRAALPVALALGVECALLTCDRDNHASRRVVEANGGLLQDQRGSVLRFWVPTGTVGA